MKKLGKIQTLAITGLAAIALATPVALGQTATTTQDGYQQMARKEGRGGKHRGRRGGHRGGMMFRGLNLTDEQKASMKQLHQSFNERTKALRQELRTKRQEMRQANTGGIFNEALATQKLTESASLQAKLMGERFKLRQEMLAVLTPEQKTQMEQKRAEFQKKRAEFKNGHGKRHGERGKLQPQQQQ
jgi:Spy/CpxP family protein refolding chaperone